MGVSKELNTPADRAAYLGKFNRKAMDAVTKIDQVIIAVQKAKTAMLAKTPPGFDKASSDAFDAGKKQAVKNLGILENLLAEAKEATKKAAAKMKA